GNLIFDGNSAVVGSMQSLVSGRRCRTCAERAESDYYAWQLANPGVPEEEWSGIEVGCDQCQGGKIRRMARFNPDDFSIVVIDECFPAGTLIDGRPIESIRPGDRVRSVNHATGEIEMRRVVRVMKSRPRIDRKST